LNTTLHDTAPKPLFARGPGLALNFFLLGCLSIALMVMDTTSPRFASARAWAAWALQPLIWVAQAPQNLAQLGDAFQPRDDLLAENRQLKQHQIELDARLLKLESLEAENERIRALLSSAASLPDRVLISEVMATSQDPYRHQIVLNRGERDGVYKGQALIDANGVMGQVIQVNPSTCVALLITDPDHGIPVEFNRTGLQTIALGRGDGQGLSLPYLAGNADVKVGDLLVSSGLGGRFPAGYPVGRVFELRHAAGENFMEALAYPAAKLNEGRQALLVWSEHGADPVVDVTVPTARPEVKKTQGEHERGGERAAQSATSKAAGKAASPANSAANSNKVGESARAPNLKLSTSTKVAPEKSTADTSAAGAKTSASGNATTGPKSRHKADSPAAAASPP
jgi:rod shape-determining protein MreC